MELAQAKISSKKLINNENNTFSNMESTKDLRLEGLFRDPEIRALMKTERFKEIVREVFSRYEPGGAYYNCYGPTPECVTHKEFDNLFDNRLSKRHRRRLDEHFDECSTCRFYLDELSSIDEELREHNIPIFDHIVPGPVYRIYDFSIEVGKEIFQRARHSYKKAS